MHPIKSHLPKTEVLTVVSKMAIFIQIVIYDIGEIFGHRCSFSMEQICSHILYGESQQISTY